MSNYPPGVTGRERQIRGMDERTVSKKCNQEGVELVINSAELQQSIVRLADYLKHKVTHFSLEEVAKSVVFYASTYEFKIDVDDCPFEGEVDTQIDSYIEFWTCPVCGHEHEDEMELPEPDYETEAELRAEIEAEREALRFNEPLEEE